MTATLANMCPAAPDDYPVCTGQSDFPASPDAQVARIVDAAANRASEGLRVIEDYARFSLDDRHLTQQLKSMRHELVSALDWLPLVDRVAARESDQDVGATTKAADELRRDSVDSVLRASFQRVQQALRTLEEFTKLAAPGRAQQLESLRYQCYTVERALFITRSSLKRLQEARLCVLVDARRTEAEFARIVKALVHASVSMIQLREKNLGDREVLHRGRLLRKLTRGTPTLYIMNDRTDLAVLSDADGVHVGQEEVSVKDARAVVGAHRLVGLSTHSIEQARQAVLAGADYIGVGPTFPSHTKAFEQFPGPDLVRAVATEIRLPAFAIGGITLQNLPQLRQVGCTRIAVSSAICGADDPAQAALSFLEALSPSRS